MFKNKNINGKNNLCGEKISELRESMVPKCSQKQLADKLQLIGLDLDKNAIQRIECGNRFVTDVEIICFCKVFGITPNTLLDFTEYFDN